MEAFRRSRRRLLRRVAYLVAGGLLLGRYLLPRGRAGGRTLSVPKAEIPANGALVYREARLAVIREGDRIYALSLVCTHLGCTLTVTGRELVCPCHGSAFDRQGRVLAGPAARPLDRYPLEDRGDAVTVTL